ncbi:hypothetical protein WN944_026730 [Citrus x changshan-huyou]|uniref:DUF4283 domain-containing protein n=1 Tax=Citrus x changshan-huyou TaxID=2935761 RepID=A0AAP0QHW8_9ROSI
MFKFGAEVDKKRVLINGPWHFNNAPIVFTEPVGIGDISKQSFTHTSFWVQLQNAPIMCMDKEILTEIGGAIGKVEEVETDANGDVMGHIIRLRVLVDITKPLTKVIMVETLEGQEDTQREGQEKMQEDMQGEIGKEEGQIPVTVQYENCWSAVTVVAECAAYKNQDKEDLPYGPWTKAQTTAERLKQQRDRGKRNAAVQNQRRNSQSPPSSSKSKATEVQAPTRNETPDLDIRATRNQKILIPEELSMKVGNEKGARSESCQRLRELASEVNINRGT